MNRRGEIRRQRSRRTGRLAAAALIAAAFAGGAVGCSDENTAGPAMPASYAVLSPGTHIIDENNGSVEFEYAVDSTLYYRIHGHPPRIDPGHIVIGTAGEGYVRRVTAAAVSGDRMILETERARLGEGVFRGATSIEIPVGFGSTAAGAPIGSAAVDGRRPPASIASDYIRCAESVLLSGGGIDIAGLSLFEGEISGYPASIRIDRGFIEFDPTAVIDLIIDDDEIEMLESRVDGTYSSDLVLSVDVPEPLAVEGELRLASAGRRVVGYMGVVPVVAVVELDIVLAYGFTGARSGGCGTSFHDEIGVSLGAVYRLPRWTDISTLDIEAAATSLSCADYSTADMWISIEPRIRVRLYGESLSAMEFDTRDGFTVATATPPDWEWSMSNRLEGRCAIDPHALAREPAGYEIDPLVLTAPLGSGPYRTESFIFVLAWGSEGSGDYQFSYPRGVAVDASDDIYVVDSWNGRLQKFAPDSTFIMTLGIEGDGEGQFLFPAAVAVDREGNIYVTDGGNDRVQKFGPDAAFVTSWGGSGNGPGQFHEPEGIAVDPSGYIYVVDSGNDRVQKFTPEGLFIAEWGGYGSAPGMFDRPIGIAADGSGNIYVTECRNHRVQKFTSSGDPIALWGSAGTGEGQFDCPIAVAVDGGGFVYVVDYGNDRVQIFGADGLFREELGGPGTDDGRFDRPEGVAIDSSGNMYIVDTRNERVQKFSPRAP